MSNLTALTLVKLLITIGIEQGNASLVLLGALFLGALLLGATLVRLLNGFMASLAFPLLLIALLLLIAAGY